MVWNTLEKVLPELFAQHTSIKEMFENVQKLNFSDKTNWSDATLSVEARGLLLSGFGSANLRSFNSLAGCVGVGIYFYREVNRKSKDPFLWLSWEAKRYGESHSVRLNFAGYAPVEISVTGIENLPNGLSLICVPKKDTNLMTVTWTGNPEEEGNCHLTLPIAVSSRI